MSGMPSVQLECRSCRWRLRRRRLIVQSPRVPALFKLRDGVIGDGVALVLRQTFFQTPYDFSGASQSESDRVSEDFSLRHAFPFVMHYENIKRTGLQATISSAIAVWSTRPVEQGVEHVRPFHCESHLGRTCRPLSPDSGRPAAQSAATLHGRPRPRLGAAGGGSRD